MNKIDIEILDNSKYIFNSSTGKPYEIQKDTMGIDTRRGIFRNGNLDYTKP
tara:strand:+ start:1246 stop:1398 length:153 start_codon:yes stop_codon:yes gene_type:complete